MPGLILGKLGNHRDLGVHTEMFSDGYVELVEKGTMFHPVIILSRGINNRLVMTNIDFGIA